ncbi:uncharacterized protein LOC101852251 [Aplysia californica]|uniref:Uncharacterized protein LOC101852251 n=1 Tax=Aplysia californica TaxID=6500 RepID=A0ABM0JTH2_APLCA|nr:uncharacterized protein LOC101852251 [Aplysia californica]
MRGTHMLFVSSCRYGALLASALFCLMLILEIIILNYEDCNLASVTRMDEDRKDLGIRISDDTIQRFNACAGVSDLLKVDVSAQDAYSRYICRDIIPKRDILCAMYLRQMGYDDGHNSSCAYEGNLPKTVFFVVFGGYTFRFLDYVTTVAAKKFIKPKAIYFVGDKPPLGSWWNQALKDVEGVRFVYRERPPNISGRRVLNQFLYHFSDLVRLQVLYLNGGIYLDMDMIVLRDLDPLLEHKVTLGILDNEPRVGNAFIMASAGSDFILEWYENYTDYKNTNRFWNSLKIPGKIWLKNASRVHMESERLYHPSWYQAMKLFSPHTGFPWKENYAMHVWTNQNRYPVPKSPRDIQTANTLVAKVFRYVLYGDPKPRSNASRTDDKRPFSFEGQRLRGGEDDDDDDDGDSDDEDDDGVDIDDDVDDDNDDEDDNDDFAGDDDDTDDDDDEENDDDDDDDDDDKHDDGDL